MSPGSPIFYGDNAQGKTNILEAVYLADTSKSHKGSKDREMIRFEMQGIPYPNDGKKGRSFIQNRHAPPEKQSKRSCHQAAADPQGKRAARGGKSGVFFSGGS